CAWRSSGSPSSPSAGTARRAHCPQHGELLGLFCDTCRCLLCPLCQDEPRHRDHPARLAEEAARQLRVREGDRDGAGAKGDRGSASLHMGRGAPGQHPILLQGMARRSTRGFI
uniref:B box-type domain-containing protein n=1 Tax=Amazona collaria TaxID=241587 RepID=A0A8B9F324_9PSIT